MICLSMAAALILIYALREVGGTVPAARKFVSQKDMSEHCRRRVMPSMFLGAHVVEAQSQMLHFSQLEVPYSCYISIRTESGSNIILVIQLAAEENLNNSCRENNNQLLVYEMGETFGGYWGPLPDPVIGSYAAQYKYYTLKTTSTTASYSDTEESETERLTKASTRTSSKSSRKKDYIEVEIPLANVSGGLVLSDSDMRPEKSFDMDDSFDFIYDVTPRPDVTYQSTIMPVVQFLVKQPYSGQQYQLDYNLGNHTQDIRLNIPRFMDNIATKRMKKYKYNANRRLNFNKNQGHLFSAEDAPFYVKNSFDTGRFASTTELTSPVSAVSANLGNVEQTSVSWPYIEHLLNKIKENKSSQLQSGGEYRQENRNMSTLLHYRNISDNELNSSRIYSLPDISVYNVNKSKNNTIQPYGTELNNNSSAKSPLSSTKNNSPQFTEHTVKSKTVSFSTLPETLCTATSEIEISRRLAETLNERWLSAATTVTYGEKPHLSTVDRESWENVVQAAPVMAGILNRTTPSLHKFKDTEQTNSSGPVHSDVRRKRYIQSISVKQARPHAITTRPDLVVTTSEAIYRFSDIHDFAQLVEVHDDEINGRVALRHWGKYVGNMLFNICDVSVAKARHAFLFNSSRIVISINRFMMKRMTLVATPARTLLSSDARCGLGQIECQVSGARVCIDSITACDGVPNCGAYDIYDEDRLRCGAFKGLQHNVYLAAFTFLAVLLTMLYTIHYWLKRCVPKVSDAFFIYTDGSENILYLDSIMRSPTDVDDIGSKMVYHTRLFDDDMDSNEIRTENRDTVIYKFKKLLTSCFCRKKRRERAEGVEMTEFESFSQTVEPNTGFSFTELEITRMALFTRDAGIQTGESLEIEFSKEIKQKYGNAQKIKQNTQESSIVDMTDYSTDAKEESLRKKSHDGELNMLKLLRDARTGSGQWNSPNKVHRRHSNKRDVASGDERELHSTLYESRQIYDMPPFITSADVIMEIPGTSGYNKKRLRFDEVLTTTIPPNEEEDDNVDRNRPSVFLGVGKPLNQDTLDVVEEDQEHSGRDFMRFWGSTKGKKSKKKSHLQLR